MQTVASKFSEHYRKLGVPGLSLRDLGDEANSDFTPEASINRQAAVDLAKKAVAQLTEKNESLMVTGGNAYLLPYANIIVEAPTRSSGFNLTDQDVPVYQIALHGYFDIAGQPFNMSGGQDPELRMLQALETGSSFYYQWFYRDSSLVKNTDFDDLYALHAADWIDSAVAMYQGANPVLKKVRGETITGHRRLANGVTKTTFSNGMQITVNTNPYPVLVNGSRIEARNYAAKER
ncbi:DUF5696 domain-containing protein [Paenibacillus sp. CC-CFT747]|nr:DUF5696 domain-containing protein [Paenibacillus sp. CC-CFT747]